ncbi:MAG: SRPBCC family protein [Verrucomicrobiota bacterium]
MNLTFERSTRIQAPASALQDWHFEEGAFEKLTPPWEKARVVESPGPLTDGARAIIEIRMGPIKQTWIAEHELTEDGFIDRQVEGPFAFWEHHHRFLPLAESTSRLVDSIQYRLPFGFLGRIFGTPLVRAKLDRMFRYRHEVTRTALENASDSS